MNQSRGLTRAFVLLLGVGHLLLLIVLCSDWDRDRLLVFLTHQVSSEADLNRPPAELTRYGYRQDSPDELTRFATVARSIVGGTTDDAERMRRIGNYLYDLRKPTGHRIRQREYGPELSTLYQGMLAGDSGSCGHMVWIMASLARSLGYDTRQIVWFTPSGAASHSALEIFSTQYGGRWMYYDMNLNGYGVGRTGEPLSIATLRTNILTGEDVRFVSDPNRHDWDTPMFIDRIRAYPLDWYLMNNRLLYFERDQRFGPLNRALPLLSRLPYPMDRVMDNLVGMRETRLAVALQFGDNALLTLRGLQLSFWYLLAITITSFAVLALDGRRHRADRTVVTSTNTQASAKDNQLEPRRVG